MLIDFFDEVLATVTRCVVVCWTVVVVSTVVVVCAVVVVGTEVVVVSVVVVGDVCALPLAGASEPARTMPAAKSAANAETLSQRGGCFVGTLAWFPSPEPA